MRTSLIQLQLWIVSRRLVSPIDACIDKVEARGIVPASQIPQVVAPDATCVEQGCQWLHYVCTDATLREFVATWHRLIPEVREKIRELVRGG